MKHVKLIGMTLVLGLMSLTVSAAGLLAPTNGQFPPLKIQQHHVDVVVEDGFVVTSITQEFYNPHSQDLETIYSFPVPEQAAVGEFTYWIDGQPVHGEVLEKDQARQVYQEEKQAGREAALTEQDEYRTFDTYVSPVRAGQTVKIRLVYLQPAFTDTGIGRYVYPLEDGGVDELKQAFWTRNEVVEGQFSFNFSLRSGYPVDGVRLPNHPQARVESLSPQEWRIQLINKAELPGAESSEAEDLSPATNQGTPRASVIRLDRDIVVYWRYQQNLPGAVDLVTYKPEGSKKGTFMMTFYPGSDLKPITEGRDWVLVLDISGSMKGKYASLIEGVRQGLRRLNPQDRFRVIVFNHQASDITGGFVSVTAANIEQVLERLSSIKPAQSTNLYAGLEKGFSGLDPDRPTAAILITDGVANVGVTEKRQFLKLLEYVDLRLFTFIMGNSANRPLLEEMTQVSQGFADSISNSDDIDGKIMLAANKLSHQVLRDIEIKIDGVRVSDVTPEAIGSLHYGQQLIVMGHYWQSGDALLTLTGKLGNQKVRYQTQVTFEDNQPLHPELERLWAYAAIRNLQQQMDYLGETADTRQAIVDLAKEYGLVTDYTSMIVMRSESFASRGIEQRNQQRIAEEQAQREARRQQAVRDNRADRKQPMYTTSRPSMGGGSFSYWLMVLLIGLMVVKSWIDRPRRT
jgi:Ca-activated chloride channel family protein